MARLHSGKDGRSPARVPGGAHAAAGGTRRRAIAPMLLIGAGVVLLLAAAGIFIKASLGYKQAADTYSGLAALAPLGPGDEEASEAVPEVDFDALEEINPDVVGWIYLPGTCINYPVVQGDDNEVYLGRLFDGMPNASGSIFLDEADAAPGMLDQQTTLYGHHMNDRSMFWDIDETRDQAAFDGITVAYYVTRDAVYKCRPLFTAVVDERFSEARQPNFGDAAGLRGYLELMSRYATARASDADARIDSADRVIDLVTCSSEWATGDRTVMVLTVEDELRTSAATRDGGAAAV